MLRQQFFLSIVGILLTLIQYPIQAQNSPSASVVSIGDGDPLRVDQSGQKLTIRLSCIDAPEMKQNPYGAASRKQLQTFLPVGSTVLIREIDRDRYGRTVAEVYQGDQSINLAMVKSGEIMDAKTIMLLQYLQLHVFRQD